MVPVANRAVNDQELVCKDLMEVKRFVSGLPLIVHVIAECAVSSNETDFSLLDCGRTFQYLRNPQSYRLCLHQVTHSSKMFALVDIHGKVL